MAPSQDYIEFGAVSVLELPRGCTSKVTRILFVNSLDIFLEKNRDEEAVEEDQKKTKTIWPETRHFQENETRHL